MFFQFLFYLCHSGTKLFWSPQIPPQVLRVARIQSSLNGDNEIAATRRGIGRAHD